MTPQLIVSSKPEAFNDVSLPVINNVRGTIVNGLASFLHIDMKTTAEFITVIFSPPINFHGNTDSVWVQNVNYSSAEKEAVLKVPAQVYCQAVGTEIEIKVLDNHEKMSLPFKLKPIQDAPVCGNKYIVNENVIHHVNPPMELSVPEGFIRQCTVKFEEKDDYCFFMKLHGDVIEDKMILLGGLWVMNEGDWVFKKGLSPQPPYKRGDFTLCYTVDE